MRTEGRHVYEYTVDLKSHTAPAEIVRMVGNSKQVLELGCGPGSITKILAHHGQCRVTGVELEAEAIKKATPYCERIVQADLNSVEWVHLVSAGKPFDVVVAADVLEHLYDPWSALKRMATLIDTHGYLVVSLPHAGHASVLSCLFNGDFEYRDYGLLDRTHIRFFCIRNIEELFAQAELKIIEARYVIMHPEETELSANWHALSRTARRAIKTSAFANVYQVVVKAVPLNSPGEHVLLKPPRHSPLPTMATNFMVWRRRAGKYLSAEQKQHIRRGLKFLGIIV